MREEIVKVDSEFQQIINAFTWSIGVCVDPKSPAIHFLFSNMANNDIDMRIGVCARTFATNFKVSFLWFDTFYIVICRRVRRVYMFDRTNIYASNK